MVVVVGGCGGGGGGGSGGSLSLVVVGVLFTGDLFETHFSHVYSSRSRSVRPDGTT